MTFETPLHLVTVQRAALDPDPRRRLIEIPDHAELAAQARHINASRAKRALDVGISGLLLLLLLPTLISVAIAIKLTSPGPVLSRHQRHGAGRQIFWILKFRTMRVTEAKGAFQQASQNDARVTAVGKWLRQSGLDELPQLLNVLMGTMSLIGPRPDAASMDAHDGQIIPHRSVRHLVRPGLTDLAQVKGYREPTDEVDAIAGRIAHDAAYIRDWTFLRDIQILLRTPAVLLWRNVV